MKKSPEVKINWKSVLFTMGFILLVLPGCATITIKDDLPPTSPKGYVEFRSPALQFEVYRADGVLEGTSSSFGAAIRIAKLPGVNDFIIKHQTYSKKLSVNVIEGMKTVGTVDWDVIDRTSSTSSFGAYRTTTTSWTYYTNLTVGTSPIPMLINSKNIESVYAALDDPDKETRFVALMDLQNSNISPDDRLISRINEVFLFDTVPWIRTQAEALLNTFGKKQFTTENLLLLDNFVNNTAGWPEWSDNQSSSFFGIDQYIMEPKTDTCIWSTVKLPPNLPPNYNIEAVSIWKSGVNDSEYGLLLGSDISNFYFFGLAGNAWALIRELKDNKFQPDPMGWKANAAINSGDRFAANRQRVEVRGDKFFYYVNDMVAGAAMNTANAANQIVGFRVCKQEKVAFEQIKITKR